MVKSGEEAPCYGRAVSSFAIILSIILSNFLDDGKGVLVFRINETVERYCRERSTE